MTLGPAEAGDGFQFRRVDLPDTPSIPADVEHVHQTQRATTLRVDDAEVHTIEHVLASFVGMGIDNATVELGSAEPPVADGSSVIYNDMIRSVGVLEQDRERATYTVSRPIYYESGESILTVFPASERRVCCVSGDADGRFTQYFDTKITQESWEKEIALARTFCFFEELEWLFERGLIKGGSLENAIVIRDDAILTKEPMRYPNEFVRHKILDIIGDFALLGSGFVAHIVAIKPSHAANCATARLVRKALLAGDSVDPNTLKA